MSRARLALDALPQMLGSNTIIIILLGTNFLFNIVGFSSLKASASSATWRGFIAWQVLGNSAGLVTVLTLTGLMRYIPMHVAQPITQGLAIFGTQVFAAMLLFHETISPQQWLGTGLLIAGIFLISQG